MFLHYPQSHPRGGGCTGERWRDAHSYTDAGPFLTRACFDLLSVCAVAMLEEGRKADTIIFRETVTMMLISLRSTVSYFRAAHRYCARRCEPKSQAHSARLRWKSGWPPGLRLIDGNRLNFILKIQETVSREKSAESGGVCEGSETGSLFIMQHKLIFSHDEL